MPEAIALGMAQRNGGRKAALARRADRCRPREHTRTTLSGWIESALRAAQQMGDVRHARYWPLLRVGELMPPCAFSRRAEGLG